MGGLVDGTRDPPGQIYMRNRYYNPQTGQFTQMDPIGIAGGLNAYGFAAGDPVSYSDPYGLCPIGGWRSWFRRTTRTDDCPRGAVGNALRKIGRYGGNQGAAVLQLVVSNDIDVSTRAGGRFRRRCGGADGACIQGRMLILDEALTNGDMASAIVHEVVHTEMDAPYGEEEPIAGGAQMQFMDKLPEHERAGSRYEKQYNLWKSDPNKWYETMCYSMQVTGSGSCP
jgi:RHS repeat-associated protein